MRPLARGDLGSSPNLIDLEQGPLNVFVSFNSLSPMNVFDLSGEVAVVIGATGELGGALAEGLGEAGARVAVLGRNAERGQARVKNIQTKGGQAAFFSADAVKKES